MLSLDSDVSAEHAVSDDGGSMLIRNAGTLDNLNIQRCENLRTYPSRQCARYVCGRCTSSLQVTAVGTS
jgi:hypothetical protein